MIPLAVVFGDEPHSLCIARSPAFPELDRIWDSRADVPEAVLLALVERECGPLLQFLENAVRRQLRLVGLAADRSDRDMLAFQTDDIVFSVSRSGTVTAALGLLRNIDLAHESVRSLSYPAEVECASFVLPEADIASMAPGDAVLLPEVGSVPPRLVVNGCFAVDVNGVAPLAENSNSLLRVRAAEGRSISLGEVFDASETPPQLPPVAVGTQLVLLGEGRTVASGRLDRLAGQYAFFVEKTI